ncbi:MAG TPA: hypothetical protein VK427_21125 [Kofleriaceae bacterium]|nr:hypothetical protein [Kofleriaceae bacterium]
MDIRFGDHASFQRAFVGMLAGSAVTALAVTPIVPAGLAPFVGGLAGMGVGAALGYGRAAWRFLVVGAATIPLFTITPSWTSLAIAAAVMGLGLAIGGRSANSDVTSGWRGALGVGLAAATTMLAAWCASRILGARETMMWPALAKSVVAASAMGMVGILAMLPRHLRVELDPVRTAIRSLPKALEPEVKGLCDRAVSIWTTSKDHIADEGGRQLVRDAVLKTLEVATKSTEVKITGAGELELKTRMEDLDARIAAATDDEVKQQYTSARAALDDQHRYREHIAKGRERLVARMHNHVAALEKFQLAATGLEATRVASSGANAIKQLEELSHEVAASGEALAEIELVDAPVAG